jgi:pimeloyl-ACP methyl ester carboxylesterase
MTKFAITRRGLTAGLATLTGALAAAAPGQERAGRLSDKARMAYVDTPFGQLHYRQQGDGPAIVLLHWAPASGRQYEPVMPLLAGAGFAPLAFDLPGYGRSYKAGRGFAVEHMAEAILTGLSALGHKRFHLLGGHLSASVAAQMAVQAPERVYSLTLDGVLLLEPAEWTALLARFAGKSPMPASGPAYRSFPFDMVVETLREWVSVSLTPPCGGLSDVGFAISVIGGDVGWIWARGHTTVL